MGRVDFAKQLGPAVEIVRVGRVLLGIPAARTSEHTIGADMDEARTEKSAEPGKPMGEQRIDRQGDERISGLAQLLHDADAIDDGFGPQAGQHRGQPIAVQRVYAGDKSRLELRCKMSPRGLAPQGGKGLDAGRSGEATIGGMAEHAASPQNEDLHDRRDIGCTP